MDILSVPARHAISIAIRLVADPRPVSAVIMSARSRIPISSVRNTFIAFNAIGWTSSDTRHGNTRTGTRALPALAGATAAQVVERRARQRYLSDDPMVAVIESEMWRCLDDVTIGTLATELAEARK